MVDLRPSYRGEPLGANELVEAGELPDTSSYEAFEYVEGKWVIFSDEEPRTEWIEAEHTLDLRNER